MSDEEADGNGWSPGRRAAALGLWTWVAFAVVAGGVFVASGAMPDGWPTGYVGGVLTVLTFGFGTSTTAGGPAFTVALTELGPTLVLLLEVVVATALLYRGLATLADGDRLARQAGLALAYLGGVSAVAWVIGFLWIGGSTPLPVGGLGGSATGALSYWPAALALSVPLAAALGRLRLREAERRDWVLDGWLFCSWLLGSLVVVEAAAGVDGIGTMALRGGVNDDFPLLLSALALFVVLAVLASFGRELAWASADGGFARAGATPQADGGAREAATDLLRDVVAESWRVKAGLAGLGLSVLAGGFGLAFVVPAAAARGPLWALPLALGAVAPTALLAWVVATAAGTGLGYVATRVTGGRTVASAAWFAATVPLVVWFYLTVVAAGASATTPLGLPAAVLAVSLAPLVGVVAAGALSGDPGDDGAATGTGLARALPVVGTGAVCGAVVVLVVAQARGLAGIAPSGDLWTVFVTRELVGLLVRFGFGVGVPVVSLLLLGDGLREYVRGDHSQGSAKPDWVDR
jgi:ABC-type dipeptide/oligopeptide/nickel transport system permease component